MLRYEDIDIWETVDTCKYLSWDLLNRTSYLFYAVRPKDNFFEKVEDVPSYGAIVFPAVVFLVVVEATIRLLIRDFPLRINDAISSFVNGMLWELTRIWTYGVEAIIYTWIYNNFRIVDLDVHSYKLWFFCMLYSDFAYYCLHRLLHEVNLLWALHQVHHSSEEFNMPVTFRLEILRPFLEWITHIPIAIAVPPPMFFIHYELHLLTQVWIHTRMINKLGFLDKIFNSPSNHRVHHGRNRRCIDKNFGGILMIYDHIFGTYEPEGDGKDIQYGLTVPLQTFNPLYVQFHPFVDMYRKIRDYEGIGNKLSVIFKGPGWAPGKPRLGNIEEIPLHFEEEKFDPQMNLWTLVYVICHFFVFLMGYIDAIYFHDEIPVNTLRFTVTFLFLSTVTNSFFMDCRKNAPLWEIFRCVLYMMFPSYCLPCHCLPWVVDIIRPIMVGSLIIWSLYVISCIIPLEKVIEIAKEGSYIEKNSCSLQTKSKEKEKPS